MTIRTELVPFHGETITTYLQDGEPFIPLKPLCARVGMDWKSQHRKITSRRTLWGVVILRLPFGRLEAIIDAMEDCGVIRAQDWSDFDKTDTYWQYRAVDPAQGNLALEGATHG